MKNKNSDIRVTDTPGGGAAAELTVSTPRGTLRYESAMTPGEVSQVRANVERLAAQQNARLGDWLATSVGEERAGFLGILQRVRNATNVNLPSVIKSKLDDRSPQAEGTSRGPDLEPGELRRMAQANPQRFAAIPALSPPGGFPRPYQPPRDEDWGTRLPGHPNYQGPKTAAPPAPTAQPWSDPFEQAPYDGAPAPKTTPRSYTVPDEEALVIQARGQRRRKRLAPMPSYDASRVGRPSPMDAKLATAKEVKIGTGKPAKPWWQVWGWARANLGYSVSGWDHCLVRPDGRIVATRIVHCNPSRVVSGCLGAEDARPLTRADVDAVVGAHVRSALVGRLKKTVPARVLRYAAALELKARGFRDVGPGIIARPAVAGWNPFTGGDVGNQVQVKTGYAGGGNYFASVYRRHRQGLSPIKSNLFPGVPFTKGWRRVKVFTAPTEDGAHQLALDYARTHKLTVISGVGYVTEIGVTGFRHKDRFVDDAYHEQQMERAGKAGRVAIDDFLHDGVYGWFSEINGEEFDVDFLGKKAQAYVGVEAIENGVVDGLKPYSRGEIVDPREVMTPPDDLLEAQTVLEEGTTVPKATQITPHIVSGRGGLPEISGSNDIGETDEEAVLREEQGDPMAWVLGDDDVGSVLSKLKSVGRGVRNVGKDYFQGVKNVGKGFRDVGKAGYKFAGRGVKATGSLAKKVALSTKMFSPKRDAKKKKVVDDLYKQVSGRFAKYAAYKRGSKVPTADEKSAAVASARKLLLKHGLPLSPMGYSTSGMLLVRRSDWEAGPRGPVGVGRRPSVSGVGFDLYYVNPLSWFRSKEVNALYLAQKAADQRQEDAQKLAGLTAETRRKWEQVNMAENALAKDVQQIAMSQQNKPQTSLVGAWWNPFSWFAGKKKKVLEETDILAPEIDPTTLPEGAEGPAEAEGASPEDGGGEQGAPASEDEAAAADLEAEAEQEAETSN